MNTGVNFFTVQSDTLTFYLNGAGEVTNESRAVIIRKARLDKNVFNYSGTVTDYYLNNQKAYEFNCNEKGINGPVKSYFPNGLLKYEGSFKNNNKDGLWKFYYDNGRFEKLVMFKDTFPPSVIEYCKQNGKMVFNGGNGNYSGRIKFGNLDNLHTLECLISGKIVNGKMEGAWKWTSKTCHGIDYFLNGHFINSENYGITEFSSPPRAVSLMGLELHENVSLFKFISIPKEVNNEDVVVKGIPVTISSNYIASHVSFIDNNDNRPLTYDKTVDLGKS
jgi:hypothetical protein